jgi:hypothetical protein
MMQFDRGELDDEEAEASVIAEHEAHIAASPDGRLRFLAHVALGNLYMSVSDAPVRTVDFKSHCVAT